MSCAPLTAGGANGKDSWEKAVLLLNKEDRDRFDLAKLRNQADYQHLLKDVLTAAEEKKTECLEKRWKISRDTGANGEGNIILRDVLEKVTVWIRKFIMIGDTIVQYDPGHAALPWAAVRFILQVTVNDVQTYGTILKSIELITNLIARCAIMESLYIHNDGATWEVENRFRDALVSLYAAVLTNLSKSLHYYGQNTAVRIAKSVLKAKDFESWTSTILEKQAEVEKLAAIAQSEMVRDIAEGVKESKQKTEHVLQFLEELQQPITRLDMQLSGMQDKLEKESRAKILRAISTIPYPNHHKAIAKDRLKGTGKWLLEKQAFQKWRTDSSSSVLWLHGIPGSGKTKLASIVVDELRSNSHLAYFYCMRNSAEPYRAQCDKILNCLVRQLACTSSNDAILEPVRIKYEAAIEGFEGFEDQAWSSDESTDVLIELSNLYPSVTLIIDALDEVDYTDRPELLDSFTRIIEESESLVKIFISSRDNIDIVMRLRGSPNLHIGAKENSEDIKDFVYSRSTPSYQKICDGLFSKRLLKLTSP